MTSCVMSFLFLFTAKRTYAETKQNDRSSRSHCIFRIVRILLLNWKVLFAWLSHFLMEWHDWFSECVFLWWCDGGGGGFLLTCENFVGMFNHLFPTCAFFFFFFEVEISLHTLIWLYRPESAHSGSESLGNSGWVFPDKLCVSSFPDRFPRYAWAAA